MTFSKIFLYFCFSFVLGIFISSMFGDLPGAEVYLAPGLISGIILVSVLWRYKKIAIAGFCLLFFVLGAWRYQSEILNSKIPARIGYPPTSSKLWRVAGGKIQNYDNGAIATLVGVVEREPVVGEKSQKLTIKLTGNSSRSIFGKILITARRYPEYKYGDKLEIAGDLKLPSQDIDGFNYRDYLQKDGIYYVMDFPKIELLGSDFGNPLMKIIFSFKNKFKETARSFISSPQEGILEALVFGNEGNISKEWKEKLNFTGTRHIAAVSGMNITIIASLILSLALGLGFWRQHAFYLTIFLLSLYILMIGAPASGVRAGFMAGVFLLAQQLGRMSHASRAVVFASTFMLALNPLLLRLDIGFQLSFLAILGIIFLQPIFSGWFAKIPNPKIFPVKTTLSTTLSAQVFTLPILIYNFGYISLISLAANLLIVPLLAPITILIFLFGLSGMVFPPLGLIFSWPTWLGLSYVTKIIDIFSKIPFALLRIENLHWFWLIAVYLFLFVFVWRFQRRFLKY